MMETIVFSEPAMMHQPFLVLYREQLLRLRKRVFCDNEGWDIANTHGYEADTYDNLFTIYVAVLQHTKVIAAMRLHPTSVKNTTFMLQDIWPILDTPKSDQVFESSRFVIDPDIPRRDALQATRYLIFATVKYCLSHDIKGLLGFMNWNLVKSAIIGSGVIEDETVELGRSTVDGRPVSAVYSAINEGTLDSVRRKMSRFGECEYIDFTQPHWFGLETGNVAGAYLTKKGPAAPKDGGHA